MSFFSEIALYAVLSIRNIHENHKENAIGNLTLCHIFSTIFSNKILKPYGIDVEYDSTSSCSGEMIIENNNSGKIPLSCFNKRKQIFLDADGGPSIGNSLDVTFLSSPQSLSQWKITNDLYLGHSQQSPPSHYFWNWGQRSPKNERFYISLNNAICGIMLISMFTNHLAIFRTRTNFEYGRSDFLYQTILNLLSNNF
uniref:Uncharacterized protein n=1 Tax=Glossina palpalis gambiensis TaxID=67801 RepID=A0A1B0BV10_9MUSC